jgi:hypothetical protein
MRTDPGFWAAFGIMVLLGVGVVSIVLDYFFRPGAEL